MEDGDGVLLGVPCNRTRSTKVPVSVPPREIPRFRSGLATGRASTRRAEGARNAPPEPDEETRGNREGFTHIQR